MLTQSIIVLALLGQSPAPAASVPTKGPLTAAQLKALSDEINRKAADPAYRAKVATMKAAQAARHREFMRRYEAERPAREAAYRQRKAEAATAEAKAQAKAESDYRKMLPFMLEAQRQQLERMSAMERNAALARMAGAAEYEAQTNKQRADNLTYWLMMHPAR